MTTRPNAVIACSGFYSSVFYLSAACFLLAALLINSCALSTGCSRDSTTEDPLYRKKEKVDTVKISFSPPWRKSPKSTIHEGQTRMGQPSDT
ncbi:unnamed protein product [Protopolystoma xenopodis]|uniref:Uncharacterized protein n=1 Tax=Protopolystoma xenopodis TaxID=117903 RepID=A0A448WX46_9PLAT|nr:unnamed protein product [Protopolystoma xenopodis]